MTPRVNVTIEGCDCTGKTTLADGLVNALGFTKIKMNAPRDYDDGFDKNVVAQKLMNNERGLLFDRGVLGEAVYGPIMRGYFPHYVRDIEESLFNHNVLIVLNARDEDVVARFDGLFITKEQIPGVLADFRTQYAASSFPNKIMINTSVHNAEATLQLAALYIQSVEANL